MFGCRPVKTIYDLELQILEYFFTAFEVQKDFVEL